MGPVDTEFPRKRTKHAQVYQVLRESILSGKLAPGNALPTQLELCKRHGVSKPTIGKALGLLESNGFLDRKPGGSSYVSEGIDVQVDNKQGVLGILIVHPEEMPDSLDHSVFGELVSRLSSKASSCGFGMLLETSMSGVREVAIKKAQITAGRMVQQGVKGVFYLPMELMDDTMDLNANVVNVFEGAGISVVLLDRDIYEYPKRSKYDIVSINNKRAASKLAKHLFDAGCKRIDFITDDVSFSSSVDERVAGFQSILSRFSLPSDNTVHKLPISFDDEETRKQLDEIIKEYKTDAFICVNDLTASCVMHHILNLGLAIPSDIKIVGFDDLPLACHLQVPLTTIRQPTDVLVTEAMRTMIDRIENPSQAPRDIMVLEQLIIRESSRF